MFEWRGQSTVKMKGIKQQQKTKIKHFSIQCINIFKFLYLWFISLWSEIYELHLSLRTCNLIIFEINLLKPYVVFFFSLLGIRFCKPRKSDFRFKILTKMICKDVNSSLTQPRKRIRNLSRPECEGLENSVRYSSEAPFLSYLTL